MKKGYAYIDPRGADIYYSAPGNLTIASASTGTVVVWAYATSLTPGAQTENRLLRAVSDPNNELVSALHNEAFYGWAMYDGAGARTFVAPTDYAADTTTTGRCGWQMLAVSWDLTAGQMRAFVNDDYDSGWVECGAPAADALRLYLGPQTAGAMADPVYLQYVAAWAGKLTDVQIAALYAEGPRYRPVAEDGAGTFTFLATFGDGYGAEVASGDGTLYTDACPAVDRYCRLPDGQFEYARQTYFLGQPNHDGTEFDRRPVWAIFHPGFQPSSYTTTNLATEGQVAIAADASQTDANRGPLAPGARTTSGSNTLALTPLRTQQPPCTYRVRMRVDSDAAPMGERMRLGPMDYLHYPISHNDVYCPTGYGSFQTFLVADDASNTTTVFLTDLDETGAGYWDGAYCLFLQGANAGRALKVASYDATTKQVTLEAALPNQPQTGDLGVVGHWARLQGVDASGTLANWQNLEVILDETHNTSVGYFPELDFLYVADNWYDASYAARWHPNYVRFDRGRTVAMEGLGWHNTGASDATGVYGRPAGAGDATTFAATLRLQKVEVSGPWQYQLLRADGEQGPCLGDNFLVWLTVPGEQGLSPAARSTKVWRQQKVVLSTQAPTKHQDPTAVQAALEAATWRAASTGVPRALADGDSEVTAAMAGTDAGGTMRLGYVVGTWDADQGLVVWADDTPPAGESNPFFEGAPIALDRAPETPTMMSLADAAVLPMPDGKWMMVFQVKESDPDHSEACLLVGAEDRWSFDRQRNWWRDNPLMGIRGGIDVPKLTGGGTGTWADRDSGYEVHYDPYTEYAARRYLAFARGKSHLFGFVQGFSDIRPLIGARSSDGQVWASLGGGREVAPLVSPEYHGGGFFIYDDGTVGVMPPGGPLRVSEDGVHWQELFSGDSFLPSNGIAGEGDSLSVLSTFRLGDQRIYYYTSDLGLNLAAIRYNGETCYALADGETVGLVETAAIERPAAAWDRELIVNVDPGEGALAVEVVDATTETVIAGFAATDCDTVPDSTEYAVRWQGLPMTEVTAEFVRLRFKLSRSDAAVKSPSLYSWRLTTGEPMRPSAEEAKVDGQAAPAGVTDAAPTFSWTYSDPQNLAQTAYRILVASSEDNLDAGTGDIWDSGAVESAESQAAYGGPTLSSYAVYFWKVLVRNSEAVWSE